MSKKRAIEELDAFSDERLELAAEALEENVEPLRTADFLLAEVATLQAVAFYVSYGQLDWARAIVEQDMDSELRESLWREAPALTKILWPDRKPRPMKPAAPGRAPRRKRRPRGH